MDENKCGQQNVVGTSSEAKEEVGNDPNTCHPAPRHEDKAKVKEESRASTLRLGTGANYQVDSFL